MAKVAVHHRANTLRVSATAANTEFDFLGAQANHGKVSRKAFEAEFGDWIAAQNARFETHGIPGADLRPW